MQGGLHPDLKIEWYEDLLRNIKKNFDIWCHCFSAPEIVKYRGSERVEFAVDTLARLRDAGLEFPARRRRGDSGRRCAASDQPFEVRHAGLDRCAPDVS